ncbi:DUF4296 domain-containing protein [Hymenobacter sp. ASUV-10]|uniref:DUF4296 domain-containing protein n=1 Tax=Hymenobacter aranciens TaxID=3063996 RepID=A0ABT9BD80_9BACT|nr:DUF4296 domain-containing protein [Hymenobacter sp. ASUV-10]
MKPAFSHLASLGLAALLALGACQRPEQAPKPADLLSREQVIRVLTDVHVLEAQVEQSRLPTDSARALFLQQKKLLMKWYNVDDSAFLHSYRYYGSHGKDLDEIYGAVNDTLELRAKKLGAK